MNAPQTNNISTLYTDLWLLEWHVLYEIPDTKIIYNVKKKIISLQVFNIKLNLTDLRGMCH